MVTVFPSYVEGRAQAAGQMWIRAELEQQKYRLRLSERCRIHEWRTSVASTFIGRSTFFKQILSSIEEALNDAKVQGGFAEVRFAEKQFGMSAQKFVGR